METNYEGHTSPHHLTDINITLHQKYNIDANANEMFPYIINNPSLCSNVDNMLYLVMVPVSATQEGYTRRQAIRKTWGKNNFFEQFNSRTIYLLGNTNNSGQQAQIEEENKQFHDIIQADFKDSYHNLTMKILMGMKWTITHCSLARYIIRANDDVFIDIMHLVKMLVTTFSKVTRTMLGVVLKAPILRDSQLCGKWCVSVHDHPNMEQYPLFYQGSIYITTFDILSDLYTTALTLNYFWIEDIFITGLLREVVANIQFLNLPELINFNELDFIEQCSTPVHFRTYISTITDTYFGAYVACMVSLSLEDRAFLGQTMFNEKFTSFATTDNRHFII